MTRAAANPRLQSAVPEPDPAAVVLVPLTEVHRGLVADIAVHLNSGTTEWTPLGGEAAPPGAAVVILAAGREQQAVDFLAEAPPTSLPIFVIGGHPNHRLAVAAMQRGARDYFALPDDLDLLRRSLEREIRRVRSAKRAARFADAERLASGFEAIVGRSDALRATLEHASRVARHRDATVLIRGETGTGKELLARAIHYHSPRAAQLFVEVNCAAIPHALLESELFGHERGSFTGATATKAGLFELAHGGTLFLDEVGNLPLDLQPKILRALESRTIRRIGGHTNRRVDVRLVAATHVDLGTAVSRNEFREDLYYRLNVVQLTLPPLRYREGDIELLAGHFLERIAASYGVPVPELTPEVVRVLHAHHWPGNIRELRNAIERALVLSPPGTLVPEELLVDAQQPPKAEHAVPFPTDLATLSRAAARAMLDLTGGNKSEAARRLGISRPRLQRLLYEPLTD